MNLDLSMCDCSIGFAGFSMHSLELYSNNFGPLPNHGTRMFGWSCFDLPPPKMNFGILSPWVLILIECCFCPDQVVLLQFVLINKQFHFES